MTQLTACDICPVRQLERVPDAVDAAYIQCLETPELADRIVGRASLREAIGAQDEYPVATAVARCALMHRQGECPKNADPDALIRNQFGLMA